MKWNLVARNPEFRRQLWLEFSATRLIGMPAVLGLIFAAIALRGSSALVSIAEAGFVVLVWAYGARLASAALLDEVSEATWDAQRLSSLTAWQLTWGKLFGGTAYAWYGGAISLMVWWAAATSAGEALPIVATIGLIAGGIALQALGLCMALAAARRGAAGARRGGAWWVTMLAALPLLGKLPFQSAGFVVWWGVSAPMASFAAMTAVVFAAWAVFGAPRMMAAALQVPQRPLAWLGFQIWIALFAAGFGPLDDGLWRFAIALALVASTAAYITLAIEPPRLDLWQRFAARWRESGLGLVTQQRAPLLLGSLVLSLLGGLLASLLASWSAMSATAGMFGAAGLPLTVALLTCRDLALVAALNWRSGIARVDGASMVLLVVLNLVLPWLLLAAGATTLSMWLQPLLGQWEGRLDVAADPLLAIGIAAVQALIALAMARAAWQPPQIAAAKPLAV